MVTNLTEALDNLYTTTWANMKVTVQDQIFDGSPFWFWLRDKGGLATQEGGKFITEPLRFTKSERVKFIGRGGTVSLSDQEFLTIATYEWRYLTDSIVRFFADDQKNRGKNQILSLMNAKLDTSRESLIDQMETSLFAAGGALEFEGLQDLCPDDPTASVIFGGINGSTNTWWRNQTKDLTGLSFGVHGHANMRTMYNNCGKNLGNNRPDLIISGQTPYEFYEDSVIEQKRIVNQKMGDAGFENIQFKGTPVVWSPSAANTRMYFLNLKFLKFTYDPIAFFDMTAWKDIPDQVNDRAAQIMTVGNLVTGRRRTHGVIHSIDTE